MKPFDRLMMRVAALTGGPGAVADPAEGLPSLVGRVCLVTGATSGHGEAVAHGLARLGAEVVIHGRDQRRCERVAAAIAARCGRAPAILRCDLSSLASVAEASARLLAEGHPLHLLVNNAGLVNRQRLRSADGHELTFAVNYLAHFALTLRLLPRLEQSGTGAQPARIVNVSSDTHRIVTLDADDLQAERRRYSLMGAYGRSKLALVYFTLELAQRLRDRGAPVTVNALDPGPVESGIGSNHPGLAPRLLSYVMRWTFPSAERASRTALRLCADPALAAKSGAYYKFERQRCPAVRPGVGPRLWQRSLELTGLADPG